MATSGKQLVYSTDEIQERDSVLCGYWCDYTIYWKDRREEAFLIQFIMQNLICQIQVSIINSSSITSKIYNLYI